MDFHIVFWHWWLASVVLLSIEMLTPGFFFMWLGFAAAVTGLVLFFAPLISTEIQLTFFAVLSMLSAIWGRHYIKKYEKETDQPYLNQRGAQYIGRTFTVVEPITNGLGKIKVGDSPWRAEGEDCPVGTIVRVIAVDGATLKVIKVE